MLDRNAARLTWRLLIYMVPSEPSRKRAFIWRELKKVGAVYLRDGVCALPEGPNTAAAVGAIAAKIEDFGGEVTVVEEAWLDERRTAALVVQSQDARQQEYGELIDETKRFIDHVRREGAHRDFTRGEVMDLEADVRKLRAWYEQIRARDYFDTPMSTEAGTLVEECAHTLGGATPALALGTIR